jgi:hypothetical protein
MIGKGSPQQGAAFAFLWPQWGVIFGIIYLGMLFLLLLHSDI